ncbi:uncharacterized protein LOC132031688 [Lycium ferocissimum]|uniref:uncharacterized protein LOC132031688 n=1 Tax=Lycium ferocissimum TaxID=112874 RepID=UPI002816504B|nr:uncharacterized protein LOC132031688 [Lycium ferocissimum]
MQSCDIPGPSSAPDTSELGGGSIVRYRPTQVESFTERCNDFEENPVLTQLTQIVSNNDVANDHSDESDSDIPLDHTETDDDHSSDDDGHSYEDITARSDGNVSYHSNAIPYLDNTEEGPDDFAFMRDDGPVRCTLGLYVISEQAGNERRSETILSQRKERVHL